MDFAPRGAFEKWLLGQRELAAMPVTQRVLLTKKQREVCDLAHG
jgi:hypothetical protein